MEQKQKIPSLANVLQNTGREVLNKPNPQGYKNNKNFVQSKVAITGRSVTANNPKYSQMSGGLNNTTTLPNFYSPFLTPSSFQIPNTRKEIYLWANWWRNNEPKVAAGINFYTNFPFNGWRLECKSAVVKDYFEKLIQKLNFQKYLPLISQSYHLYGDAFVLASIDCPICHGKNVTPKGELCLHQGATWKSLALLNPDSIQISPGFMDQDPIYSYLPNDREIKVVLQREPSDLFDAIPEEIRSMIARKMPIKLSPECIHHFKHGADPWADYGTSLVRPLFVTLAYKDKLRQAQWLVAERHIIPTKIVTVGDERRPASQEDLDSVQDQLSAVANDPNLTLVTPHGFKMEFVGANGQILPISQEFDLIEQEILDGLMLNKSLLNGEGPNYGNAQVGLISMNERLETWRREVAQWIEEKLFKMVAKWNGFTATGDGGQEELIYPKIIFDDLKLKDNVGTLQMLVTAQEHGVISTETLVEQFGLNWDQEVERLRFEQGMNFVNSQDIMNTDMNIGYGGVTGNGFGAGLNQPLSPGVPLEGSNPGEIPTVPGAEPPTGGSPAEPAEPTPTANSNRHRYRLAASILNELNFNQKSIHSLTASKYLNKIDEEINGIPPITGRILPDDFPEDINPEKPWSIAHAGVPLNYLAQKEIVTAKVKEKKQYQLYNNLEKELYKIIMSMSLPFAFYAQYESGPSNEYILDGAFPLIKLGVEADGEVWHNNNKKIVQDRNRDINLMKQGWTILRFTDKQIQKQPQEVAKVIYQVIQKLVGNGDLMKNQKVI